MTWHALGGPSQVALSWLVNVGGHAYSSDLAALAGLQRDGLARHDADDDTWRATDRGRAVYHARHEPTDWGVGPEHGPVTDPFYNPASPNPKEQSA